ncbi:UPF0061 protein [Roseibium aquae]|uniref:Protein nucleotidyltransferase YdiU n=1 Tax=Roseibium aquae TaxID=1323746 RepID=A0A916WYZ4_9HYPH|nr:YdiU family protein [Roseibium aquae]GGB43376.1 UPF0061 protein [Roseibium aquae]
MTHQPPRFNFDNSYAREMDGFYVPWEAAQVPAPELIVLNTELARDLGLDPDALANEDGAAIFAGVKSPEGASPLAQVYAGHQFGGFSPQLGDGRALLIGEIVTPNGERKDIQLKGSGPTPFSRGGDGKAVVGPVLREYIIGEAMHALGIPTTRALAAVTTGETIIRNGPKPGAVLTRVASSHLRVGTFQYFAARGETEKVRQLADYAIRRHDPDLAEAEDRYLAFFQRVIGRQAHLVAQWVLVGFVHGVMNTDNTTISGETIDYGPCAFIDSYDPDAVFSSIDHGGRYAYARQPVLAQWNLARLAECLLPLLDATSSEQAVEHATQALDAFPELYQAAWLSGLRAKLGLTHARDTDLDLANQLFEAMAGQDVDFTLFFRQLAAPDGGHAAKALFSDPTRLDPWLAAWTARLADEGVPQTEIQDRMNAVNPLYIPRNHMVEDALAAAETGDFGPANALIGVLRAPFTERDGLEAYARPAPDRFGPYTTFCGT